LTKIALKFEKGKCKLVAKTMPDPEEAKRMWREGKSAQYILEQAKRKKPADKK
jgi:hypothetical protein